MGNEERFPQSIGTKIEKVYDEWIVPENMALLKSKDFTKICRIPRFIFKKCFYMLTCRPIFSYARGCEDKKFTTLTDNISLRMAQRT
jgi:hypothetical protein